ncbi:1477_t:CDS:2, partial [Funneliformis geosporum]
VPSPKRQATPYDLTITSHLNLKLLFLTESVTGRTKPLSLKSTPEFHQRLKTLASEEKCLMIEILERALAEKENEPIVDEKIVLTKSSKRQFEDDETEQPSTNSKKRKIDQ